MSFNIYIFYDYFSPAYKAGGPIRSIDNLVQLLDNSCSLFIVTSNHDHDGSLLPVKKNSWIKYSENCYVIYLDEKARSYTSIKNLCNTKSIDLIYINGLFSMFTTIIPLRLSKKLNIPTLIAPRGMLQEGALAIKALKKRGYLWILKNLWLKHNESIFWHATDNQEVLDIKKNIGSKELVRVVGNVPSYTNENPSEIAISTSFRFITISLIAPKKNHLWFVESLKRVDLGNKKIIYDIYGPADREYLEVLQKAIAVLPNNIEVNIKSPIIPTKVNNTLRSYHYFVLPTYGENFGHAIFEAFNAGRPVLISDKTPWLDLKKKNAGWDLPLDKNTWDDILKQCLQIDQPGYNLLSAGARRVAEDYIDAQDLKTQYIGMFEEASKD